MQKFLISFIDGENTFFKNQSFIKFCIIVCEKQKTMNKVTINRRRHIFKAVTWNLLAMTTTYLVLTILPPYCGLEGISKEGAGFLTIVDRAIKLLFYYGHERAWFASNFGVIKNR
jgi:hypothetical protein